VTGAPAQARRAPDGAHRVGCKAADPASLQCFEVCPSWPQCRNIAARLSPGRSASRTRNNSPLARHTPSPGHGRGLRPVYIKKLPPRGSFGPLSRRSHTRKSSLSWSPLTESNRRPSPYHGPPAGLCNRRRGFEQAERWLTLAEASADQPSLAALAPQNAPRDDLHLTQTGQASGVREHMIADPQSAGTPPGISRNCVYCAGPGLRVIRHCRPSTRLIGKSVRYRARQGLRPARRPVRLP